MFQFIRLITLSLIIIAFTFAQSKVFITEITDPQNSSDAGRYVELYNNSSDGIDFIDRDGGIALIRWTNGNSEYTPSSFKYLQGTIPAYGFFIVCNDADKFAATWPDLTCDQDIGTGGAADSNGDDNIALVHAVVDDTGANIIDETLDMFGVAGEDGSGTGHEFEDGRAERADGVCSGAATWDETEWNIDNDSGGGDGNQYAPEGFDPGLWIGSSFDCGGGSTTCDDEAACNTGANSACEYPDTGYDCDGNCIGEVDCAGVCGGDAVEDCAGECGGSAAVDDCGECGGDGSSCSSNVTFSIDMSYETVSENGVSLQDFTNWINYPMTYDDGVYSVTINLTEGDYLYKFKNGDSYENVDDLDCAVFDDPDGDGFGYWDRSVTVSDSDITLSTDCFSACGACSAGCTDSNATNYDENANVDDDSCEYETVETANLFFSEYAEGSSNNKYLEIYNATSDEVDLSGYSLSSCSNGCNDGVSWDYPDNVTFDAGTTVASGDVYVVCHGSADDIIQAECDQTFTYLSNGDDVFALTQIGSGAILDIIGEIGDDPGSGWEVAGVSNGTKDHTLVRASSVESGNGGNWEESAGDADSSEWEVYDQNTWDYLGSHTMGGGDECTMGDINGDGDVNVLDIVQIVGYIVDGEADFDTACADSNGDGSVNVLDIVALVNDIVGGSRINDATSAKLIKSKNGLILKADGYIGGVQLTLQHSADFSIKLSNNAWLSDYATHGNQTILVIVNPSNEELFTTNGNFEIIDMIVANSHNKISAIVVSEFILSNAYPNPFNPSTTVELSVPESGHVSLMVYNLTGQLIAELADANMNANNYQFTWSADNAPSAMYLLRAEFAGQVFTQKLMLLK